MTTTILQIPTIWYYLISWGIGGFIAGLITAIILSRYLGSD